METFLMVLQFLVSAGLITVILLQKSKGEGLGSIGGGSRMFFEQNKGIDATLESSTKYLAIAFGILSLVLTII